MKALFDYFPIVAFFLAYYIPEVDAGQRLLFATAVAMVAVCMQVFLWWLIYRRFESMHLISLVAILILGGATLLTEDKRFFLWKPTVVYWLFSLIFLASEWIGNKPLIQRFMEGSISLSQTFWLRLSRAWVLFFVFMGILNLLVAFNFPEAVWVNFKLFGTLVLTVIFALLQAVFISRHMIVQDDDP